MNAESWKQRARQLESETYTLYLAYKDPRVPWYAKAFAALLVGYVFSPIDPIPDFIPVVGLLDELVVVPLGVILARKMIPEEVLADCRRKSQEAMREGKPVNHAAAAIVFAVWLLLTAAAAIVMLRMLRKLAFGS
jgi:uncharacterized membrane protein YkvA (DUF1232 family)